MLHARCDRQKFVMTNEYHYVVRACHPHTCSLHKAKKNKLNRKGVISIDMLAAYSLQVCISRPQLKPEDCIAIACEGIGLDPKRFPVGLLLL